LSLTFVPTPLGNLRDITLRALEVLRDCDLLVAEDTRVAKRLLSALDLPGKELWSYREQNAAGATAAIVDRARLQSVAVVTDAGTPGISDPGRGLVGAARDAGVAIDVLPGPSAFVCALVLSGFALDRFAFDGFVSRASGKRERAFRDAFASGRTTAYYEAPNRIVATLATLETIDARARLFLARELTKRFEQQILGTAAEISAALERPVRGEIVLVLEASRPERIRTSTSDIDESIDELLLAGKSVASLAKDLAKRGFGDRSELYRRAVDRKSIRSRQEESPRTGTP
jgi:16S rRNA (cytidine1402-2'-O)-methyltransferase